MLALFWSFYFVSAWFEMTMFARFMSRLAAHFLLLLGFFCWWFASRGVSCSDKFLTFAVFVLGSAAVLAIADPSIGIMAILMTISPAVMTAWVAWLWLSRSVTPTTRRVGLCAVILLVLGSLDLIRWDGVEGTQRSEFSWRWTPTSEQIFLASHEAQAATASAATTDAAEAAPAWTLQKHDVPSFRGAERDGVVGGEGLLLDWSKEAPKQVWRQRLGPGWSSLIVVDGNVVTQEQRDDAEVVACYDAATGAEKWVHADKVRFHESLSGAGPRGTPEFVDGRIYAIGGLGNLNCLDAATGKLLWTHDLVKESQAAVPQWGFAVSPLAVDGKVIVFAPGKEADGLIAYDAATGELAWKAAGGGDTYSSPQLAEFGGVRQVLMHDSQALRSVSVEDGKPLWEIAHGGETSVPMLQPHVLADDKLLVALEAGLTLLDVKQTDGKWSTEEVWISNRIRPNFNDFVTHKGKIYGLDDGILVALDLETGERLWKKGRYGHGQLLLLAERDALVVLGARGEVTLVSIAGDAPEVLGEFESIEGKTWNHPALVANRLYVRNGEEIACYELPQKN
jgi:outer membrane protein assembly factor BamB